ncbi:MAG: hypothetical protein M1812_006103 [Candelaria pacifica]|nr:MAG: hypothetical protein M1812_006103 [Candelaria pacifica]
MKSTVILSGLLSLGGMMITPASAMPFDLDSRDATAQDQANKNKPQACELRVWQHSRRSDNKDDHYFLNYQLYGGIIDGKDPKKMRSQYINGFDKIADNNALAITVPAAEVDSKGNVGQYGATLKITAPALGDKKFKTELERDNAPLSFKFNADKWTTATNGRCTVSNYQAWPKVDKYKLWGEYAGEGPLGFPGKDYRMIICKLECIVQPEAPVLKQSKAVVKNTKPVKTG